MQIEKNDNLKNATSEQLARAVVKILVEKQGIDIKLYNVKDTAAITDYYVLASGKSSTHVSSLSDDVDFNIEMQGKASERIEGKRGNSWILIDYIDVIVNIFDKESREFYNFERLMPSDGQVDISDIVAEVDKKFDIN